MLWLLSFISFVVFVSGEAHAQPIVLNSRKDLIQLLEFGIPDPKNPNKEQKLIGFMVQMQKHGDKETEWFTDGHAIYASTKKFGKMSDLQSLKDLDYFFDFALPDFLNSNVVRGTLVMTEKASPAFEAKFLEKLAQIVADGGFTDPNGRPYNSSKHAFLIEVSRSASIAPQKQILALESQASHKYSMGWHEILLFTHEELKAILGCQGVVTTPATRTDQIWKAVRSFN